VRAIATVLVLALALAVPLALPAPASPGPPPTRVRVWIDAHKRGAPVPSSFLGLSFELSSLHEIARAGERGNLVTLLRSLGSGVLRFGGVSADTQVAWTDAATPRPSWASQAIGTEDLQRLARLASRSGWRILLTIGLAHFEPQAAAREAQAAQTILGGWLAGIELGNEPNAYASHDLRVEPWTFSQYAVEAASYLEAIAAQVGSRLPLAGPDVSGSPAFSSWGNGEAAGLSPTLLTGHHYPLGCNDAVTPTVARLLSQATRRSEGISIRRYTSAAARARIPFRLDETGSVSCGGQAGVSNTFGAALWAVDYIARTMSAGMAGINFHGNVANCLGYSPLCATDAAAREHGALQAQPVWYALLLDRALVGDERVRSTVRWSRHTNVDVVAMRAADGTLHVVLVDDDPPEARPVVARILVGDTFAGASVLALRGPSPLAPTGVTLGGATVARDGSWSPAEAPASLPNRAGTVTVMLSPSSAELLTLAPKAPTRPTGTSARVHTASRRALARRG
jgi:hypothetical protein